jgi:hypothetical protein
MSAPKSSYFTTASFISGNLFKIRHAISQHFNLEKTTKRCKKKTLRFVKVHHYFCTTKRD